MTDTMNECVIEWIKGDKECAVTMPKGTKLYNRIVKLAETNDDVTVHINKDGSMFATLPTKWVKINPSRTLTDEQKAEMSARMKDVRRSVSQELSN